MTLWIVFGLMTAAAFAFLVVPLVRGRAAAAPRSAYDLAVYKDQLREVERDLERGLLSPAQAEAMRTEIERRMLAVAEIPEAPRDGDPAAPGPRRSLRRMDAIVFAAALTAGAALLYLELGSPDVPGQPFAERRMEAGTHPAGTAPGTVASVDRLVESLAARLEQDPNNMEGWQLLGRSYIAMGRWPEAAEALGRAVALGPGDSALAANYGEALVNASGGSVTPAAAEIFTRVRADAPDNPTARYYLALHMAQRGEFMAALQEWTDLVAISPPGAGWLEAVRARIERTAAELGIDPATVEPSAEAQALARAAAQAPQAPGPSREDVEAAAEMSDADREAMIRTMVARLAQRLEENPDDLEGWRGLARAYTVLGETDKAREAAARAAALESATP